MPENDTHETAVPAPDVMPVDRAEWAQQLGISNFINAHYQLRDVTAIPDARRILVIGPGQGLDTAIFRWRGFQVETFDIDETFKPDHIGSAHDLSRFRDGEFDVVIASHVLEHLALPYLDTTLAEFARVARWALVYLPIHGRQVQARLTPGFGGINMNLVFDVRNPLERADGLQPRYMAGQHFWEIGLRGFSVRDVKARFSRFFEIERAYRNPDWPISFNFVLRSKR